MLSSFSKKKITTNTNFSVNILFKRNIKSIVLLFLVYPLAIKSQSNLPRFEHDTLYTSGGYKIYKGQTLHLGKGSADAGYFSFITFLKNTGRTDTYSLQDGTILVNNIKAFKYSGPDDCSIRITGTATYANGKSSEVGFLLNFERSTQDYNNLPPELIVPQELRAKTSGVTAVAAAPKTNTPEVVQKDTEQSGDLKKMMVADEIKKLFDLYKAGALTKDEYEAQKKKLLSRQ